MDGKIVHRAASSLRGFAAWRPDCETLQPMSMNSGPWYCCSICAAPSHRPASGKPRPTLATCLLPTIPTTVPRA